MSSPSAKPDNPKKNLATLIDRYAAYNAAVVSLESVGDVATASLVHERQREVRDRIHKALRRRPGLVLHDGKVFRFSDRLNCVEVTTPDHARDIEIDEADDAA